MTYELTAAEVLAALGEKYNFEKGCYRLTFVGADAQAEVVRFEVTCIRKGPPPEAAPK